MNGLVLAYAATAFDGCDERGSADARSSVFAVTLLRRMIPPVDGQTHQLITLDPARSSRWRGVAMSDS